MDKALLVCLLRALIFGSGFRTRRRDQIRWVSRVLMAIVVSLLFVQGVVTSQSTPSRKSTPTIVRQEELRDLEIWMQNSSEPTAENQNPTRRNGKNYQTSVSFADVVLLVDSLPSSLPDVMVSTMVRTFTGKDVTGFERDDYCFDLRDIDPNSVSFQKMPEGYYAFSASTTNDELKIEERVSESADGQHWKFQSRRETFFSITIELNPHYGPSFTQAFKQAVILAGGEPSNQPKYPASAPTRSSEKSCSGTSRTASMPSKNE